MPDAGDQGDAWHTGEAEAALFHTGDKGLDGHTGDGVLTLPDA